MMKKNKHINIEESFVHDSGVDISEDKRPDISLNNNVIKCDCCKEEFISLVSAYCSECKGKICFDCIRGNGLCKKCDVDNEGKEMSKEEKEFCNNIDEKTLYGLLNKKPYYMIRDILI